MLDRTIGRIAGIAAAAIWIASTPAAAQTNDPSLTQRRIDCANDPSGCVEGGVSAARPGVMTPSASAVPVADLIVDLFPAPEGGAAPGDSGGNQAGGPVAPPSGSENGVLALPPPAGPAAAPAGLALAAAPRAISGDFVPDEVLVTVDGGAGVVQQLAAAFGLEVRSARRSLLLGATIARFGIPDGRPVGVVLAQLAADGRALRREPNHVYALQQAAAANYAFGRIALDERQANGDGVRIGVIDTGIDDANPALNGVIGGSYDAMPGVAIEGRDHGTSVDGLIAGVGPFRGMAPGARIFHARAFEGGKSTMDVILSALDWTAGQDVRIINMSFVGPKNDLLGTACRGARALGIVLVAAAGNNGPKAPYGYPAAFDGVLAVTATDDKDALMRQANRGAYVYISAPGVDMVAPIGGGSDLVTGTSFAAAIVTGAIANLIHQAPDRSAGWIEEALAKTARDLGPKGRDVDFGYGLLDIAAAGSAQ